jgi:hypothetical protein
MRSVLIYRLVILIPLGIAATAIANDKPAITIQVVETKASERVFNHVVPGSDAQSHTNCDTNATTIDYGSGLGGANGTTTCTTTTTPGTPARTVTRTIPQAHVFAIMPNGDHVTLWCQKAWRNCVTLSPGSYTAEIDKNNAWIYAHDLSGKQQKIKFHSVGGW